MNAVIQSLKERRAIRKYLPRQITDEELNEVLEAGIYAPTGHGWQSPVIVAVQDRDTIAQLERMNANIMGKPEMKPFYGALMNAAHAIGLGSCWIHRAKEEFESAEGKALLQKWGIRGDYEGIGHCILGYPDESPEAAPRKPGYIFRVK
jgi:nitroreductase